MSAIPRFSLTRRATPDEIDELGHVSNVVYVRWLIDIAIAHSDHVGWDAAAYQRLGAGFVVRRHEIDYLAPVRLGDEVMVETAVESWRLASSVRGTEIRLAATPVLRAKTTWAFIDRVSERPCRIPDSLRAAFGASPPAPASR